MFFDTDSKSIKITEKEKEGYIYLEKIDRIENMPYKPYQLNVILEEWLYQTTKKYDVEVKEKLKNWLILNSRIQIMLFKVAYFTKNFEHDSQYNTLEHVLSLYKKSGINCDMLFIPISQVERNHFRLLVIKPSQRRAIFYDSKDYVSGKVAETYYITRNISHVCAAFFSGIHLTHVYKNDQWNNIDCGPWTFEYIREEILKSLNITSLQNKDIKQIRASHQTLYEQFYSHIENNKEKNSSKSLLKNKLF